MKAKTVLTAFLATVMVLGISASKAQVKVKFGPKASFTLNTMNYSEKTPEGCKEKKMEYSYTPGFNAGMFLDVRFNPTITLGTELFVAKQGAHGVAKVELPTTSGDYEGDITTYTCSGLYCSKCHRLQASISNWDLNWVISSMVKEIMSIPPTSNTGATLPKHWIG